MKYKINNILQPEWVNSSVDWRKRSTTSTIDSNSKYDSWKLFDISYPCYNELRENIKLKTEFIKPHHSVYVKEYHTTKPKSKFVSHFTSQFITMSDIDNMTNEANNEDNEDNEDNKDNKDNKDNEDNEDNEYNEDNEDNEDNEENNIKNIENLEYNCMIKKNKYTASQSVHKIGYKDGIILADNILPDTILADNILPDTILTDNDDSFTVYTRKKPKKRFDNNTSTSHISHLLNIPINNEQRNQRIQYNQRNQRNQYNQRNYNNQSNNLNNSNYEPDNSNYQEEEFDEGHAEH